MWINDLPERIRFWRDCDRIGPDIPWTHWRLFFKSSMLRLCRKKFHFFGENADVRPGSYLIACSRISIGKNVVVRPGSVFEADPRPGEHGIVIEDDALLSPGIHLYVNNHAFEDTRVPIIDQPTKPSAPIVIKRGSWIGANAIILAGVTIGEQSVVGAGSVVTKDVPPRVIVAGVPARVIRDLAPAERAPAADASER
jgi:acetyltransferase-like isoleucine patch superfamily enzyme